MTRILHVDSRQKKYHKEFGDVSDVSDTSGIPAERIFTYTDVVEQVGAVTCVAIAGAKACGSQTGKTYDYQDSFDNAPHNASGMIPSDWFASIVKRGLKVFGSTSYDKIWNSYWSVHTDGAGDAFDNTINASNHANSAVTVWTNFYPNWVELQPLEVMPQGEGIPTDHDWVIKGWQMVNGVQMMVIDWHDGQVNLMPREVFNLEVAKLGCGTGIPATAPIQAVERRTILQYLIDLYQNLLLLVESQAGTLPPTSTELAWDTRGNCSHSVRVIADEMGMTLEQKNVFWACIRQESDFNPLAENDNKNSQGQIVSSDFGICQINDRYHIGEGLEFPSVQYVLDNPEACVRWMCACFLSGQEYMWVSYTSGAYKQWLPYVPIE